MPADTPIRASTQEFLEVEDIQDDIVLLKGGSCALILQVTAVNFGLLSEGEQDAMIYAYAGMLNSLSFPIQIVIRSKKKDISSYLQLLKDQETKLKKPILIEQMKKYRAFVETTVRENEVLDKKFYVSIPFSPLELGVSSTLSQTFKSKKELPYSKAYIFERAKTNLYPKRDHLTGQLRRLGLKSRQLTTQELLQLVYSIYNPESVGQQFVPTKDYTVPMVQAATTQLLTKPKKEASMNDQSQPNQSTNNQPSVQSGSQTFPQPTPPQPTPDTTSPPVAPSLKPTTSSSSSPTPPRPPQSSPPSPKPQASQPSPSPAQMGAPGSSQVNLPPTANPVTPQPSPGNQIKSSADLPATSPVTLKQQSGETAEDKVDAAQIQNAIDSAAQQAGKQPAAPPAPTQKQPASPPASGGKGVNHPNQ